MRVFPEDQNLPLPDPAPRRPMHTRRVTYHGFQRDDGLWDIEGELHDSKPFEWHLQGEGMIGAGEPVHHMHIRVTLDDTMTVKAIVASMDRFPHAPCAPAGDPLQRMVGARMGGGWRQTIERHLGGVQGCTHLRELLYNMATAAFQTMANEVFATPDDGRPPLHLGKCMGWDFNGPMVQRLHPVFFGYQPPPRRTTGEPANG